MSAARLFSLLSLLLSLAFLFGCGSSKKESIVRGKVTYKGNPVTAGTVTFNRTGENKAGVSFPLRSDGTYEGGGVPPEEMVITIETESANPNRAKASGQQEKYRGQYEEMMKKKGPGGPPAPEFSGTYVPIPKKYGDVATSPFKCTLTKGKNELDFDLKDD
jgi:hypothetical protein